MSPLEWIGISHVSRGLGSGESILSLLAQNVHQVIVALAWTFVPVLRNAYISTDFKLQIRNAVLIAIFKFVAISQNRRPIPIR